MHWLAVVAGVLDLLGRLTRYYEERRWIARGEGNAVRRLLQVAKDETDKIVADARSARAAARSVRDLRQRD